MRGCTELPHIWETERQPYGKCLTPELRRGESGCPRDPAELPSSFHHRPLHPLGLRSLPLRSLPSSAILKWRLLQPSLVALFIYFAPTGLLQTHSCLV